MARGGDMQEVELLDGDEVVTEQPDAPARSRRGLWWLAGGAGIVALSLVGTQLVVDAREDAAAARLAAVPGVFPPLGDELAVQRTISQADATLLWAGVEIGDGRSAGLVVATDGSQSFTAIDQRTGEALWTTPLLGPHAERAAALDDGYGGMCQGDGLGGRPATTAVCLVTDGFVRYEEDGTEERFPATSSRAVVFDLADGHVVTEWDVDARAQLALVGDLVAVGTRDEEQDATVVAHDARTGAERWRYADPAPADPAEPADPVDPSDRYWGLMSAGDALALYDGHGFALLSPTGTLVRDDLRASSRDVGFGTDPTTGTFEITTYAGTGARTTRLLARDGDPAGDVVLRGEPVQVTVDDGSLPGVELTYLSHTYAWDRRTGEQLWESEVQPAYNALVVQGRVYLTSSTTILALDGRDGEVLWRTPLPEYGQGMLATDGRDLLLTSTAYDPDTDGGVVVYDLATGVEKRRVPYPEGVSDVQLMHGVLVGWSYETEKVTFLQ